MYTRACQPELTNIRIFMQVLSGNITHWHLETEITKDTELTMELLAAWHMAAAMAYESTIKFYIKEVILYSTKSLSSPLR